MTRRAAHQTEAEKLTEAQWQRQVTDLADAYGWLWYHPWLSVKSRAGWPDLFLCHPRHGALAIELKTENRTRSKLSPEQIEWLWVLNAAGIRAICARPSDLEAVRRLLAGEEP